MTPYDGNFHGSAGHPNIERAKVTIEDSCKTIIPFTIRVYNVLNCTLHLDKTTGRWRGQKVHKSEKGAPPDIREMEQRLAEMLLSDLEIELQGGDLYVRNLDHELLFVQEAHGQK
ncbi:MAG: hypothetical protein KVP17_002510 [Porospora cf. gigantea B]|uniref:uncharacterized protein n=1 Tax=Porospora cf. gigantea B TaxID=2853592 RepID=UPI0035718A58|nr:MAG: hypothetical protein KVP17_002510 [Porospora cf. gigantea B]